MAAADSVALAPTGTGKDPAHGGANPMIVTRMMTNSCHCFSSIIFEQEMNEEGGGRVGNLGV